MTCRVLVVDDDRDIRESLVEALEDVGYACDSADNGSNALQLLRAANELPHVILLDLMMPVMDGETFLEERLNDPRVAKIPVVVLSAYRDITNPAPEKNVVCAMKKPVPLNELTRIVQKVCAPC